jgi:hypothetical protein
MHWFSHDLVSLSPQSSTTTDGTLTVDIAHLQILVRMFGAGDMMNGQLGLPSHHLFDTIFQLISLRAPFPWVHGMYVPSELMEALGVGRQSRCGELSMDKSGLCQNVLPDLMLTASSYSKQKAWKFLQAMQPH